MAYRNEEDIFGDDEIEIAIRFEPKAIQNLNNQKNGSFDDLKKWARDNQSKCYFFKKNDDEHKILIQIENVNKSINVTLKWLPKTFDYKAVINRKSKSVIQNYEVIENDKYSICEECNLSFIDFNAQNFPSREQNRLYEQVCELEISPKSNIENQQEIWERWIEAQQLILDKNSQPIEIVGYQQPDSNSKRLQFRTKLEQKENPEYDALEEALKSEPFNIAERFDADGTIFLKYNDIHNGIDRIINKEFSGIFERNQNIGCITKIRPYLLSDSIKKDLKNRFVVKQNSERRNISIQISKRKETSFVVDTLFKNACSFENILGQFSIEWPRNIKLDRNLLTEKKISFDWDNQIKGGIFLPEPIQNSFIVRRQDFDGIKNFYEKLVSVFGKDTIKSEIFLEFHPSNDDVVFETEFNEEFWTEIKREFYSYDFEISVSESEQTIAFDFVDKEELENRYEKIEALNLFNVVKSPLEDDFKFKVRTELIAKKSKKQEFVEKIKSLAGVEFQIDRGEEFDYRKRHITIGNLAASISDLKGLVFNLPYKWEDEKKQTDKFLKFIDEEPEIDKVIPNLRGDQVKISWLNEAMNKVNNPQAGLDGKPVNDKLKDFVFDSSKADEVFRDLSENTEDWNELKRHELLTLNNSQRRAILSALHAPDLALLQGPPGTGKTTVIAEMIWQMVRSNQEQKVLLTSETNLAVDNALEKLLNENHTLVKPIRFGRASKFEEEGKKYSFERIIKWIDDTAKVDDIYENEIVAEEESEDEIIYEDYNNNAVQLWMRRIADNSQQGNPKYSELMKDWAFEMAQPRTEMKVLFRDKYFKYCNVVGSTSSSAGSPRFGADFQRIFNENKIITTNRGDVEIDKFTKKVKNAIKKYKDFGGWYNGVDVYAKIKSIEFDTVITDEASKATPPELLLPMCFGKKNVIIGDHRQLPPMLHDKSFKEVLETLETKEAKELSEEIDKEFVETSQFERLISHPDVPNSIKSTFNEQYRMHPKINNVIKQFYLDEGGLEPGKPIIENADDTNLGNPFSRYHGFAFKGFIKPDIHTIWINVDELEEKSGTSRINKAEVEAVVLVLKLLRKSNGFAEYMNHWDSLKDENKRREEKEIGLISFYGHQVGKLKDVAKYSRSKLDIPVRLNTVDKFQGMERNIIVVSTVRSNKINDFGFARSPQRLNVALSRAKRLLIVVGNKDFFSQYQNKEGDRIYKNVADVIQDEGLVINYKELKKKFADD